jgi:hypothetical protein
VQSLGSSSNAAAWAGTSSKPYDPSTAGDRIDAYMAGFHGGSEADWRDKNWITFKYDDSSWIFMEWADGDGSLTDGGSGYTGVSAHTLCRFYNDSGAPGCNPWASGSFTADTVFDAHFTSATLAGNTAIGEAYPMFTAGPLPDLTNDIALYYHIENKKITLVDKTHIPPLNLSTMECRYQVTGFDHVKVMDVMTPCDESNFQQVTVTDWQDYQVNMDIVYDINHDGVILPEESVGSIQENITVDGSYTEGIMKNNGIYPKSDLKDCSGYGADIAGAIGCHFYNFGLKIRDFFVPDPRAVNDEMNAFGEYFQTKLGFIYDSIAMIMNTFSSLTTAIATPTCNLNTGSISGHEVDINLCNVRTSVGSAAFDLALTIFRGSVAIGFAFGCMRYARNFFAAQEEDYLT